MHIEKETRSKRCYEKHVEIQNILQIEIWRKSFKKYFEVF